MDRNSMDPYELPRYAILCVSKQPLIWLQGGLVGVAARAHVLSMSMQSQRPNHTIGITIAIANGCYGNFNHPAKAVVY